MEQLIWRSLRIGTRAALLLSLGPFVLARELYRLTRWLSGAWVLATNDAMWCSGCGELVSLVGRWECGRCRYVFDGFAFAHCPVCSAVPPYILCQACGVGLRNPVLA